MAESKHSTASRQNPISQTLEELFDGIPGANHTLPQPRESNGVTTGIEPYDLGREETSKLCKVKVLYEGPSKCPCCINWDEDKPTDWRESIEEQDESKKHALLIRMKKNHGDGKPLVLDSIVVQSPELKELLQEVFHGYGGITTSLKKLVFKPPFHPFFYEWDRFNRLCNEHSSLVARNHAKLLQNVLETELEETLSVSEDLSRNGVITYEYLWSIFKAGVDVCASRDGHDYIYRLTDAEYGMVQDEACFILTVQNVDCDGKQFGWATSRLAIPKFSGTKPLAELDIVPASMNPRVNDLKQKASVRGARSRSLQQSPYHYAQYRGLARGLVRCNQYNLDGRILIDPGAFQHYNDKYKVHLKPLHSLDTSYNLDVVDESQHHSRSPAFRCGTGRLGLPPLRELQPNVSNILQLPHKRTGNIPQLDDEMLYLCSPEVRGYCLKTKKWATFYVDSVTEISWNEDAFDNLVMAKDHKRMVLSFVDSQVVNKDSFDDMIEGKGQGLIMLLEGSPGVGKTLTAEAVADKLRRPLYAISGGELCQNAQRLEESLNVILEIAAKWDAVLLLDECDVFLEQRSADNLQRNATVAVFLRLLEHYRGILFMTTNRIESIDPAFQSRIHLTIQYPRLNADARRQIWKHFLGTCGSDTKTSAHEIQQLAEEEMNGREIKNLTKTAQLLARHENTPLSIEHIRAVLGVMHGTVGM